MIYIVIPTFNERVFVRSLIKKINKQTYENFKMIICDNGSTDGTVEMIRSDYPNIQIMSNDDTYWWTKSVNSGITHTMKTASDSDFILIMNSDTIVYEDYLNNLIKCQKTAPSNLIGSVTVDLDSKLIKFGGVVINKWTAKYNRINHNRHYDDLSKDQYSFKINKNLTTTTSTLPGRGLLISVPLFKKIGYFDESLPQYFADYEFGLRASKNSIDSLVCYSAPVYAHIKNTGLNNELKVLSHKDFMISFFSRKSPNFLLKRALYIYKSFGIKYFFIHISLDFSRLIFSSFMKQFVYKK